MSTYVDTDSSVSSGEMSTYVDMKGGENPIDQALGRRIAQLRARHQLTLERVAAAAREIGLSWSRQTVWAIEKSGTRPSGIGTRRLNVAEFLLLPTIFETALAARGGKVHPPLTVDSFLPRDEHVDVGRLRMPSEALRRALKGASLSLKQFETHAEK
jgi:transcriptional regulator with XRE-family HTH domain